MSDPFTFQLALTGQALIEGPVAVTNEAAARLVAELCGAHLALANFEATLSAPHAWPVKMKTLHASSDEALASLRKLGINALGLANNHAYDLGPPGLAATRTAALAHGFTVSGSGANLAEATAPGWLEANGRRVALFAYDMGAQADMVYARSDRAGIAPLRVHQSLAVPDEEFSRLEQLARAAGYLERMAKRIQVDYSEAGRSDTLDFFGLEVRRGAAIAEERYVDEADLARAFEALGSARAQADLVVVSLHHHHWNADWRAAPAWFRTLTARLVEAGADIVYCHGAPVLQGMALHRGRPIFYGMGNFIFHTHRAARYDKNGIDVWRSVLAQCDFAADQRLKSVCIRPLRVGLPLDKTPGAAANLAPEFLAGAEAGEVMERFLSLSALEGASVERRADHCRIRL